MCLVLSWKTEFKAICRGQGLQCTHSYKVHTLKIYGWQTTNVINEVIHYISSPTFLYPYYPPLWFTEPLTASLTIVPATTSYPNTTPLLWRRPLLQCKKPVATHARQSGNAFLSRLQRKHNYQHHHHHVPVATIIGIACGGLEEEEEEGELNIIVMGWCYCSRSSAAVVLARKKLNISVNILAVL